MNGRWYYRKPGTDAQGPISMGQLQDLAALGDLLPDDQVCPDDSDEWRPAGQVPGLFNFDAAAPPLDELRKAPTPPPGPPADPVPEFDEMPVEASDAPAEHYDLPPDLDLADDEVMSVEPDPEPRTLPTLVDVWRRLHEFHLDGVFDDEEFGVLGEILLAKVEELPPDVPRPAPAPRRRAVEILEAVRVDVAAGDEILDAVTRDDLSHLFGDDERE